MALHHLPGKIPDELSEKEWKDHKSFFQSKTGISAALKKSAKQFKSVLQQADGDYHKLKIALEDLLEIIDESRIIITSRYNNINDSRFNLTPKKTLKFMKSMISASEKLRKVAELELKRVDKVLDISFYDLYSIKEIYEAFKIFCKDKKKINTFKLYRLLEKKLPTMDTLDFRIFYEKHLLPGKSLRVCILHQVDEFDALAKSENWDKLPYLETLKSLDRELSSDLYPEFLKLAGKYL